MAIKNRRLWVTADIAVPVMDNEIVFDTVKPMIKTKKEHDHTAFIAVGYAPF